ncbi:BCCT family transporter [Gracilibacillus sp. S3-1-1]|uniref:BCCT family transporter n=1 Tax=Gracilibacillus pellucidus TaxID=3095368 RepID=A0ACC6M332_9BACI|nr:BCCT family transporter [Gracilibacillus sp. S3-1-1]MDX8045301.1 BCCT family transporter [Gracilibacillus sp. S3-1-1]
MKDKGSVFWISIVICAALVVWGAVNPDNLLFVTSSVTAFISDKFGWYYLITIMVVMVFCIFLIFSPISKLRLGKDNEKPEYSLKAWLSMLFSAGLGVGLVFYSTAEPISHAFSQSPSGAEGSDQAIKEALQYSFFHWGLHGWVAYAFVGLCLAYFKFYKGYPGLISSTLIPLLGEKLMKGWLGKLIDILAVIATVVGVASTLGFASAQVNSGLAFIFNTPETFWMQVLILAIATVLFIGSAWSGISKGIKTLSTTNMTILFSIAIILFAVGPTLYILEMFTNSLGGYITNFFSMSFSLSPLNEEGRSWIDIWTLFYWAWWISWAPFVGMFIARISRGRTVRELLLGVLFVPPVVCFIFFSVFGISAINLEQLGIDTISSYAVETTTFGVMQHYPLGTLMSIMTIVGVSIFFITSADSATFVLGMFSTYGSINPSNSIKVTWGLTLSAISAIIIYFGGVQSLQDMFLIAALPFSIVLYLMIVSFYKSAHLEVEKRRINKKRKNKRVDSI